LSIGTMLPFDAVTSAKKASIESRRQKKRRKLSPWSLGGGQTSEKLKKKGKRSQSLAS